jgi:integrase
MNRNQDTTEERSVADALPPPQELALALQAPRKARQRLLALQTELVSELAAAADAFVRENRFTERQGRKAWNTVRKEIAALSDFMAFLGTAGIDLDFHLAEEPRLWSAITFGLAESFLIWERHQGYAIKTLNDHLDVIKLYAKLAHQAGFQTADQLLAIQHIPRIRGAEAERIDAARDRAHTKTRRGSKKAEPTFLAREEFAALLQRPAERPQGQRDLVAILLMYDLSLRPSEVVSLQIGDVNMEDGTIHITRHKTHDEQRARLTQRLYLAMRQYLAVRQDTSPDAPLIVRTLKSGDLVENLPSLAPEVEAARSGGRRPYSSNRATYARLQPATPAQLTEQPGARKQPDTWTPPMTTRGLREHLHEIGLDIADALYGEHDEPKKPPRTRRRPPRKQINLTSYDGRHEWTRRAIRGGSNPIAVTKAGGWKGHSAMVARYYGELEIVNEDIVLAH